MATEGEKQLNPSVFKFRPEVTFEKTHLSTPVFQFRHGACIFKKQSLSPPGATTPQFTVNSKGNSEAWRVNDTSAALR